MDQTIDLVRKRQLITDMISEVRMHSEGFNEACPLKILALKYGKRANPLGGIKGLVLELEVDGTFFVSRVRTGGIHVSTKPILKVVSNV